jgi:hypothetical protein
MWKARVNAWVNVEEALYTKTNHFQKKVEIPFPLFFLKVTRMFSQRGTST